MKGLNVKFEKAVRLLTEHLPVSDSSVRKPVLFHDIRVGVYLYENGYAEEIVLAGVLHDAIEWSDVTKEQLIVEFGDDVTSLVMANTKNRDISDKEKIVIDLIQRCVNQGEDALVIKVVDVIDSFKWYETQNNVDELKGHCVKTANVIRKYKPSNFDDEIFNELEAWRIKYA